jgi:hypothetical protein
MGISPEDFAAGKEEAQEAHDSAIEGGAEPMDAMTQATDTVTNNDEGGAGGEGDAAAAAATAAAVAASTEAGDNGVVNEGDGGGAGGGEAIPVVGDADFVEAAPVPTPEGDGDGSGWGGGSEAATPGEGSGGDMFGAPPIVSDHVPGDEAIPVIGDPDFVEAAPVPTPEGDMGALMDTAALDEAVEIAPVIGDPDFVEAEAVPTPESTDEGMG